MREHILESVLASGAVGVRRNRFAPTFWIGTLTTMLILLGAAVQDSANGKDVYQAFAVRMGLFFAVTAYAVFAVSLLEALLRRASPSPRYPAEAL